MTLKYTKRKQGPSEVGCWGVEEPIPTRRKLGHSPSPSQNNLWNKHEFCCWLQASSSTNMVQRFPGAVLCITTSDHPWWTAWGHAHSPLMQTLPWEHHHLWWWRWCACTLGLVCLQAPPRGEKLCPALSYPAVSVPICRFCRSWRIFMPSLLWLIQAGFLKPPRDTQSGFLRQTWALLQCHCHREQFAFYPPLQ